MIKVYLLRRKMARRKRRICVRRKQLVKRLPGVFGITENIAVRVKNFFLRQSHGLYHQTKHFEHRAFLNQRVNLHTYFYAGKAFGCKRKFLIVPDAVVHHHLTLTKRTCHAVYGEITRAALANERAQITPVVAAAKSELPHIRQSRGVHVKKDELHVLKRQVADYLASSVWKSEHGMPFDILAQKLIFI